MLVARLAVLLIALLIALAPMSATADDDLGKKLYTQRCAGCHGPDGKGNPTMAQKLKVTIPNLGEIAAKPDSEVTKIVSEGKKPMPAFGKSLKSNELDAVVHYVKALAKSQAAGK